MCRKLAASVLACRGLAAAHSCGRSRADAGSAVVSASSMAREVDRSPFGDALTQISSRNSSRSSSRRIRFIVSFESRPSLRIRKSASRCAASSRCSVRW